MNLLKHRRWKKAVKHILNEAKHARHMREDIVAPEKIQQSLAKEEELKKAWSEGKGEKELEKAAEAVQKATEAVYPPVPGHSTQEFVEVIAVALIVAMGLRAYFIQPFKIPTGSMQPTLNGITYQPAHTAPGMSDKILPLRFGKFLLTGRSYKEWKAEEGGIIARIFVDESNNRTILEWIGRTPQVLPSASLTLKINPGSRVQTGDILASAWKFAGDHIFVDKIRYNFTKPKLGQVFVFNTLGIQHPQIKPNNYYIKRIAGIPGDTISIDPPYLIRNGEAEIKSQSIMRVVNAEDGYNGYTLAQSPRLPSGPSILHDPSKSIHLEDQEYLPLGDNSRSSLDGRYFGSVEYNKVVGPAFFVYWPFTDHWGLIH